MPARRLCLVLAAAGVAATALAPAPAGAAIVRLTPEVLDATGDYTGERAAFLAYELRLPPGARVARRGDMALWEPRFEVAGRPCRAWMAAVTGLARRELTVDEPSRRRRDLVTLVRRDGSSARLVFARADGRFGGGEDRPGRFALGALRLPDDVAPGLAARFAHLSVVSLDSGNVRCRAAGRALARRQIGAVFASWQLRVVGDYVPPPPDLPPPTGDLAVAPALRLGSLPARAGLTVAGVADFDGDGGLDVAVGVPSLASGLGAAILAPARGAPGSVAPTTTLGRVARRAVRPGGHPAGTAAVAGLGDLDGDGRAEVALGAPYYDLSYDGGRGVVNVVFGRPGRATVALDRRRERVVRVASRRCPTLGADVANVGDVDGRGKPDLGVVALPGCPSHLGARAFVVFGESLSREVDILALGVRGFAIALPAGFEEPRIAAAGDVDADGHADLVIGLRDADNPRDEDRGGAFVAYGGPQPGRLDFARPGTRGFEIVGARGDEAGATVAGLGDVDGDGYDDIGVGAPREAAARGPGRVYLVRGGPRGGTVHLDRPGAGTRVDGPRKGGVGWSLAAAGDRNRDGLADFAVGAPAYSYRGRYHAGAVFLVHGMRTLPRRLELRRLGAGGERYVGPTARAQLGEAVAPAGDVDADGIPDLVLAAPGEWGAPPAAAYVTRGRP